MMRSLQCLRRLGLGLLCCGALAQAAGGGTPLVVRGLGAAAVPLDGEWQFRTGDDLQWAQPGFDDSGWQAIRVGQDWETQGHRDYTGFAWYRGHVAIADAAATAGMRLALFLPSVDSAAEVYWNGVKVGSYGRVPPDPKWYGFGGTRPLLAELGPGNSLGPAESGVLAIRVWKAPYVYFSFPNEGGIVETPLLGSMEALRNEEAARLYRQQLAGGFSTLEARISAVMGLLALLFWLRNRRQTMLMWPSIALVFPEAEHLITTRAAGVSFRLGYGLIGPAVALGEMAIWFLLIALLGLENRKGLVRWTRIFALTALGLDLVDSVCQCFDWTAWPDRRFLHVDVASTLPAVLVSLWGLVLVIAALRNRLDAARWVLAVAAVLSDLRQGIEDITGLGVRWTHWTVFQSLQRPLLEVGGNLLSAGVLINTTFLLALVYSAWRYSVEQRERQGRLEQEVHNVQALQQVLVPESVAPVGGYAIGSAYRPAQEVGGDFFQVVPLGEDAALLVIGDVSGKGLPAAMAVAMIVGAFHSTAEMTDDPATILWALNRRLHGRLRGGFATCLAIRLRTGGECTIANAGHLPPYLNGAEMGIVPSLPLGLALEADYEAVPMELAAGDRMMLYTDGLLEARNAGGELFGFARIAAIAMQSAEAIAQAAQAFGQEDDITVLTVARVRTA